MGFSGTDVGTLMSHIPQEHRLQEHKGVLELKD